MKKLLIYIPLVLLFLGLSISCNKISNPVDPGTPFVETTTLTGQVVDESTGLPLQNAAVVVLNGKTATDAFVDDNGLFRVNVPLENGKKLNVIAVKEGYYQDSLSVDGSSGKEVILAKLLLKKGNSTYAAMGAASIILKTQSVRFIGVKESGSNEIARVTFEVQDSTGSPIDFSHSSIVSFRFGSKPNGGEYLSTGYVRTDYSGKATVSIVSGTKAGSIQLVAEIVLGSKKVVSKPVNIAIHGGLPNEAHFSVAPQFVNIPGLIRYGDKDVITAYVGDKYGNPVKKGTVVYFTTTGGYVEGSGATDSLGIASVILLSAKPEPVHPTLGPGFAIVTAQTADENLNTISTTATVLFSGSPLFIEVTPSTFDIPNRGSEEFSYIIKDLYNNPMSFGQTISVTAEGEGIKTTGEVDLNFPDTQSPSWTQFAFAIADADTSNKARKVIVTIRTDGPNGSTKRSFSGIVN
ncbi:MAG: hypothetical protein NTX22_01385 [Ignavibacteriales bacterium]|nr:hypothetical protein [Ignavibacteriales bacterium]